METRRIIQIVLVVILLLGAFIVSILYSFTSLLGKFASVASIEVVDRDQAEIDNDDSLPEKIDEHEDDVKTTGANPPGENLLPGPDTTISNGNAPLEAPNVFTINAVNGNTKLFRIDKVKFMKYVNDTNQQDSGNNNYKLRAVRIVKNNKIENQGWDLYKSDAFNVEIFNAPGTGQFSPNTSKAQVHGSSDPADVMWDVGDKIAFVTATVIA
ncbi:hypothetical protein EPVG_00150 [Emiliania huxleyi virus 201]|nr:hypothetical protein ELVG_00153 [Emiliania huxleyi virus 203]AEP15560.1 hypothetical protein EQVG_00150 [Emiliania huxleyi virus 207]AEP15980.1 hypothetical protein ERVG_00103 [Emiliania huxleyi virus 208]AET98038.1 hypothetical protein EPVG_00150 [Emiliania huxleyi virus 201]